MSNLDELREKLKVIHCKYYTDVPNADALDETEDLFSQYLEQVRSNDPHLCEFGHEVYSHKTVDGWCCACEADQAFMEEQIRQETLKARINENENWARHIGAAWDNEVVNHEDVHKRLGELQAQLTTNKSKER